MVTVLWLVGGVVLGRVAAITVEEHIVELNRNLAAHSIPFAVCKQSYAAGFLSGTSRAQVMMDAEAREPVILEMDLDIDHGPFMLASRGPSHGAYYIGVTSNLADGLQNSKTEGRFLSRLAGRGPKAGGVLINFSGGQTVELGLAPFKYFEAGTSMALENGIARTFSTDGQFSTLVGSVKIGAFSDHQNTGDSNIEIAESTLTQNVTQPQAASLLTGAVFDSVDAMTIKIGGEKHRSEDISAYCFRGKKAAALTVI